LSSETDLRTLPSGILIRDAEDSDSDGLIALIGGCFAEYPGCVFDLEELPELLGIATHFQSHGGRFWVAEGASRVIGCVGFSPGKKAGFAELKKLYVEKAARTSGLGSTLCALVEDEARRAGFVAMDLWSDTRFSTAHRFYERRGYVRGEQTRDLHDKSNTVELYFERPL
jgi:putative acetyltransferase